MCPILLNPDDISHPDRSGPPTDPFFPRTLAKEVGEGIMRRPEKNFGAGGVGFAEERDEDGGREFESDDDSELVDERALDVVDQAFAPSRKTSPPTHAQRPLFDVGTSDRNDLISRIKNGESPVWRPKLAATTTKLEIESPIARRAIISNVQFTASPTSDTEMTFPIEDSESNSPTASAFHSGFFQPQGDARSHFRPPTPVPPIDTSFPKRIPLGQSPLSSTSVFASPPRPSPASDLYHSPLRSYSLSSNLTLGPKFPTSPLVHESRRSGSPVDIPGRETIAHRRMPSLPSFSPISPTSTPRRRSLHQPSPVPLVGSYEESILSLRMSLPPSKPLPFIAQIGVLALGPCKPSLRCPHHITIPFNAFFYGGEGWTGAPSPYVGIVELPPLSNPSASPSALKPTNQRRSRRSTSSALTGGYRIPPKGQVQIVIKNANKTGIKLFLVPYDLTDMPAGSRTFLRQKSFVVRPAPSTIAADGAKAGMGQEGRTMEEPEDDSGQLRYLVQLNFCSPSKGRYYLYKNVRVVFANRTLDGKEKLRNEIIWADPRWSTWRP